MSTKKTPDLDVAWENRGFLSRNRTWIGAITGLVLLHIGWYRIVEVYVPEKDKPTYFPFSLMRKLDPFVEKKEVEAKK